MGENHLRRITKNTSIKKGLKPGSLIHIGTVKNIKPKVNLIEFGEDFFDEKELSNIDDFFLKEECNHFRWINVDGLSDISIIEKIGEKFKLHPLLLEDVLNTNSRPKVEEYDSCVFTLIKLINFNSKNTQLIEDQLSLVIGDNFIISFQERTSKLFDTLIQRIKMGKGIIRKAGIGYLCYSIIDTAVDDYFEVLEKIEDRIEELEEELISHPSQNILKNIYGLKRELIFLRKSVWPVREVVNNLQNTGNEYIKRDISIYMKDVGDHVIQVIDTIQLFIDIISGMLDTYLSSVNNKMNEIMKVLTIFSTIFIPITFLAGVYGMNFPNMPEYKIQWMYPVFWSVCIVSTCSMLYYFRKRNWF